MEKYPLKGGNSIPLTQPASYQSVAKKVIFTKFCIQIFCLNSSFHVVRICKPLYVTFVSFFFFKLPIIVDAIEKSGNYGGTKIPMASKSFSYK